MRQGVAWVLALAAVLVTAGCGGDGPTSASGPGEIVMRGTVIDRTAATPGGGITVLSGTTRRAEDPIIVTVQGHPEIRATVAPDGTFTLRGLPEGDFILVFTRGGVPLGTQSFTEVAANQEITVTIEIVNGEVVLLDEHRTGIGHVDLELEGRVERLVTVNPAADSRFVIAGRNVIARPGVTAIREGMTKRSVSDLAVGMRVHVKGALVEGSTDVLAHEIKIQNGDETGDTITICHIPPGNPGNRRTLTVGVGAWPDHQAHGDTLGPCPTQ